MLKQLIRNRKLIIELSHNDFKNRFSGSYLGIFWAFIQPIINVSIYWMIFDKGLKAGPDGNIPFLLWLIAGICPWFYLNDALNGSSNCLVQYGYIVKKVKFNVSFIPLIKIISSAYIHVFFMGIVILIFMVRGFKLSIYAIQCVYYSICITVLIVGLVYFVAAINVFFRDMAQIVAILLQYSMWMVPIMMAEDRFPIFMQPILKFNPLYYVVQGYRDSLITHVWFWERPLITMYYWGIVVIVVFVGIYLFKRLKPSFADVL